MTTAYEVLGVDSNSDDTAIQAAFRRAAKECHPDLNKGDRNGERLRILIAARATLISLRRLDRDRSKSSHPNAQPGRKERSNILAATFAAVIGLLFVYLKSQQLETTRAISPSQTTGTLHLNGQAPASREKGPDGALAGTIDKPAQPSEVPPSFDIVYADERGKLVAAGRGMAGWIIRLMSGTKTLGEATADERNDWVLTPEAPLAPGNHALSLFEIDPASQRGISGQRSVTLSIAPHQATDRNKDELAALYPLHLRRW